MIKKSLLTAVLATVALTGTALAYSPKDSAAPTPRVVSSSVVKPTGLPPEFAGATINVEFALDAAGQPRDVEVLRVSDPILKRRLVDAFRQWRFEPGVTDHVASAKRFVIPILLLPEA
jgi:TonB family protein